MSTQPIFTRYLYDSKQVTNSLAWAIIEKKREEVLFWAYELYHSGFQTEVWYWVRDFYVNYYEEYNPLFKYHLDRFYLQWKETGDPCLIGTVVGTLSMRDRREDEKNFILLYKEDRHQMKPILDKPRNYLMHVSQYPIRFENVFAEDDDPECQKLELKRIRDAYLGPNWLYYCSETPVWLNRILEFGGRVAEDKKEILFETDEGLEAFYDRWGFEPDEQSAEMHKTHGICIET